MEDGLTLICNTKEIFVVGLQKYIKRKYDSGERTKVYQKQNEFHSVLVDLGGVMTSIPELN